jgi:hypothetical protein
MTRRATVAAGSRRVRGLPWPAPRNVGHRPAQSAQLQLLNFSNDCVNESPLRVASQHRNSFIPLRKRELCDLALPTPQTRNRLCALAKVDTCREIARQSRRKVSTVDRPDQRSDGKID